MCNVCTVYVGEVLGTVCTLIGPSVFRDIRDTVLLGVKKNLEVPRNDCNISDNSSESPQVSVTLTKSVSLQ